MEVQREFREDSYKAACRCWEAARTADDDTRRSLERAGTRYFWLACGMERTRTAGESPVLVLRACDERDQADTLGGDTSA